MAELDTKLFNERYFKEGSRDITHSVTPDADFSALLNNLADPPKASQQVLEPQSEHREFLRGPEQSRNQER